jgi:hypothetical protein
VTEPDEPGRPVWLTPDRAEDPPGGAAGAAGARRQTLLLVAGGVVVLGLVAGLAGYALLGASSEQGRPRPRSAAAEPVVAVEPASTASPTPSAAEPSAAPTTPAAQQKPHVTAAAISIEPASVTGPCPRSKKYVQVKVTVTVTVSVSEVQLRYTVDGGTEHAATVRSRTYTDSWAVDVRRQAGSATTTLKVTAPSAASDTATFTYTCD